jgi:hypothetical protein
MRISHNEREYIADILEEAIGRPELGISFDVNIGADKSIFVTVEVRSPRGDIHVSGNSFSEVRTALGNWMFDYHEDLEDML